jgi:hypothetical protein
MKMMAMIALTASLLICGCGKQEGDKAKDTGKKVGDAITGFAAGVGSGADKRLLINLALSPELEKQGISMSTAKSAGLGEKAINVYLIAKNAFKGTLISKAYNKEGAEIGRSLVEVDFGADDAKYIAFKFNAEMDSLLVDKFVVDVKK